MHKVTISPPFTTCHVVWFSKYKLTLLCFPAASEYTGSTLPLFHPLTHLPAFCFLRVLLQLSAQCLGPSPLEAAGSTGVGSRCLESHVGERQRLRREGEGHGTVPANGPNDLRPFLAIPMISAHPHSRRPDLGDGLQHCPKNAKGVPEDPKGGSAQVQAVPRVKVLTFAHLSIPIPSFLWPISFVNPPDETTDPWQKG